MAAQSFDDAEKVLLKQYLTAIQLSEALETLSEKYYTLWDEVIAEVRDGLPELNVVENRSTTMTGPVSRRGAVIIASDRWPADGANWPTGFWADDIGLNVLAGGAGGSPLVGVWFAGRDYKNDTDVDAAALMDQCFKKAGSLFTPDERDGIQRDDENNWFGFAIPSGRLLEMLVNDQGDRFVNEMVSKFQVLTKLIPSMNELLPAASRP